MKPEITRNVRLPPSHERGGARPRWLERLLLGHQRLNRVMAHSAEMVLTAMIWPRFVAPYRWELTRHELRLANLDARFEGFRILQLTDLHAGKTRFEYLMGVVEKSLREKPDLVVITGDLIDYGRNALPLIDRLLKKLVEGMGGRGGAGVVAIFGNHDYHEYSWRHIGERSAHRAIHTRLVKIVQENGVRLLRNEQVRIRAVEERDGEGDLFVVGLDEMWTGRANAEEAFRGRSARDAIVCLQHNPDGVEFLKAYPWQVMLCGHSHGGQANFPVVGALYVPMEHREYLSGFFSFPLVAGQPLALGERRMFVSRGLGHSTPIRWRCSPEATVFTLRCVT